MTGGRRTVLVTGATGFIGSHLVDALAARGDRVRALSRTGRPKSDPLSQSSTAGDVEYVQGDISDRDSLARACQDCDQVFHLAGYAKNWSRDPQTFYRINVDGLKNVLDAARDAAVQRVVWTSTIMTFGPTPVGEVCDETYDRTGQPCYTDYEKSKMAGEALVASYVADGMSVVIVNPTRVFGPGRLTEGNSLAKIIDEYDRGKAPALLNRGRNVGNYVLVDDVVQGHLLAMEKGRDGERYILGGENLSLKEFFSLIDEVSGKRHFQFTVRWPAALGFAHIQVCCAKWFGGYPAISPPWVRTFMAEWAYSSKKAEEELGYQPTPVKVGVQRTYEWLLDVRQRSQVKD